MKKAALHNLGCKVNAYETEAMQQMLEEAGYEIVPFSEKADVYVINTSCTGQKSGIRLRLLLLPDAMYRPKRMRQNVMKQLIF